MAKQKNETGKIVLGTHRVTYVHIKEPSAFEDEDPKYNITFLIPYDHPDVERIEAAMQAIYKSEKESTFGGLPFNSPKIWNPLRDGLDVLDEKPDRTEYEDCMFIKATSKSQPVVFDADGSELYDLDDLYSGCYARAVLAIRAFNSKKGKRGFSVYINSIKFIKDGERLGGFSASHDDYDEDDAPARGAGRGRSRRDEVEDRPARGRGRSRDEEPEEDEAPRRRSRASHSEDDAPARRRRPSYEDEDTDDAPAPRGRRSRYADDEDDAPPRRRSRRVEDDDDLM